MQETQSRKTIVVSNASFGLGMLMASILAAWLNGAFGIAMALCGLGFILSDVVVAIKGSKEPD